jgi:hypothetical protein
MNYDLEDENRPRNDSMFNTILNKKIIKANRHEKFSWYKNKMKVNTFQ